MKNSLKFVLCALLTFAFAASPPEANAGKKNLPVCTTVDQKVAEFNLVKIQSETPAVEFAYCAQILASDANLYAIEGNREVVNFYLAANAIDQTVICSVDLNLSDHSPGDSENSTCSWVPRKNIIYLSRYSGGLYCPRLTV